MVFLSADGFYWNRTEKGFKVTNLPVIESYKKVVALNGNPLK